MHKLRERDGVAAAALEFQILTAVKPGNAVVAKWDQIDRQTSVWTIPAALMKSDAEHRVPLSKAALAVLDRMQVTEDDSEYIFPNSKGKPLSDASMAAVIDRMNELDRRWIDPKFDREIVPHGFRSSFRDWAAEHGYDDPIAEAAPRAQGQRRSGRSLSAHNLLRSAQADDGGLGRLLRPTFQQR